jgi:signal transduction histidine kinase
VSGAPAVVRKAWRGLGRRLVVATAACGLVGLLGALLVTRAVASDVFVRLVGPMAMAAYEEGGRARCEASPETFRFAARGGQVAYAYDAAAGRSRNPLAPPLDRSLALALAQPGAARYAMRATPLDALGVLAMRADGDGPCAIVQLTWPRWDAVAYRVLGVSIAALVMAILGLVLGGAWLARPLLRRIERVRRAADQVGATGPDAARAMEALAPAREGGDDELDVVARALSRAHTRIQRDAAELEAQRDALQRHLADVSHDLRTPIASLLIALEQIEGARDAADARALVAGALRDAVYLGALTENLRMASALEAGYDPRARQGETDLKAIVLAVAARSRIFAERQDVDFDVAVPDLSVTVVCDAVFAERALGNLVENAVTYVGRGGHVAVLLETAPGRFTFTVLDDGPGVDGDALSRLGDRTFRGDDARRRDPRGSGLGLAITREVCERHGWSLAFAAEVPHGLRVTIDGATVPPHAGGTR